MKKTTHPVSQMVSLNKRHEDLSDLALIMEDEISELFLTEDGEQVIQEFVEITRTEKPKDDFTGRYEFFALFQRVFNKNLEEIRTSAIFENATERNLTEHKYFRGKDKL